MLTFCFFLWEAEPSGLQSGPGLPSCPAVLGWVGIHFNLDSPRCTGGWGGPALCPSSQQAPTSQQPLSLPTCSPRPPCPSFEDLVCASFSLKTPAFSGTEVGRETFPGGWPSSISRRTPLGSLVLAAASPEESWLWVGGSGEGWGVPPIRFPSPLQYGALAVPLASPLSSP